MSYIVESLVMQTPILKSEHDCESDSYNDLLLIEKKIKELEDKNLLTDNEILILNYFSQGYLYEDIEDITGIGRVTISKIFKEVCNKIAYFLGGSFTNEGLINDMIEKYNLTEEQTDKLDKYIYSRYRQKYPRIQKENKLND
jgi:hypothetical protein